MDHKSEAYLLADEKLENFSWSAKIYGKNENFDNIDFVDPLDYQSYLEPHKYTLWDVCNKRYLTLQINVTYASSASTFF